MKLTTLILLALACTVTARADETLRPGEGLHVDMHKNPGCGCCDIWADHLRAFGFTVRSTEDADILDFKAKYSIPAAAMSCHTGIVEGYFVEGHVPARDILRLLKEKPDGVTGLAVPGMPLGSPGMEHPRPQDFRTVALLSDGGAYVFADHEAGKDHGPDESE